VPDKRRAEERPDRQTKGADPQEDRAPSQEELLREFYPNRTGLRTLLGSPRHACPDRKPLRNRRPLTKLTMNEISTNVTPPAEESSALSVFSSQDNFELAQRAGKMLAASDLVPQQFRGNVANCVIALNIASRIGADPFAVLQSLYIVHGRPAWSSQFLIAMVNASGRYTPLQFRMTGDGDDLTCVAHAKDKETGEPVEGPPVSIQMAKDEGWATKSGSKWVSMAPLMLRYRAGAFFSRIYAPDLCLGMRTMEEEVDIREAKPAPSKGIFPTRPKPEPEPEPKPEPVPIEINGAQDPAPVEVMPPEPEPEPEVDEKQAALTSVLEKITESEASGEDIESVLRGRKVLGAKGSIAMLGTAKLNEILGNWLEIEADALNRFQAMPFED